MKSNKLKSILTIACMGFAAFSFVACDGNDVKNAGDNAKKQVEQGVDSSKSKIQEGKDKVGDTSKTNFTAEESGIDENYLINELGKKGFDPKKVTATKQSYDSYFMPPQQAIKINGGEISVYQYAENQKGEMMNNLNSLTGMSRPGGSSTGNTWIHNAHVYQKGRIFVVYGGTSQLIMNALSEILGAPMQ